MSYTMKMRKGHGHFGDRLANWWAKGQTKATSQGFFFLAKTKISVHSIAKAVEELLNKLRQRSPVTSLNFALWGTHGGWRGNRETSLETDSQGLGLCMLDM